MYGLPYSFHLLSHSVNMTSLRGGRAEVVLVNLHFTAGQLVSGKAGLGPPSPNSSPSRELLAVGVAAGSTPESDLGMQMLRPLPRMTDLESPGLGPCQQQAPKMVLPASVFPTVRHEEK